MVRKRYLPIVKWEDHNRRASEQPRLSGRKPKFTLRIRRALQRGSLVPAALVLIITSAEYGQDTRPNFTGTWKSVQIIRGQVIVSTSEIEQTSLTLDLRPIVKNAPANEWLRYRMDGQAVHSTGRNRVERMGHWEGHTLVLETTGPGNAPWRRSTTRQALSLSNDGRILTIRYHDSGDKEGSHDYAIELERVER